MTVLDLPDAPGAARDTLVLHHVQAGDAEVMWVPLLVANRLELLVMGDALKLGGVRIGAGAQLAQQCADLLGALLLTPRVLDLMYQSRGLTIEPQTQYDATQMLTTHWFEKESARIDAAITSAGGPEPGAIVQTVGKPWCVTNALLTHPGKACNYGWHVPPGSVSGSPAQWKKTPAYLSVSLPGIYVLQQPGFAHGLDEADYSEMIVLMHRSCKLDGVETDLATVLQDSTNASLVSHEGPLKVLRQPGVALYSCALPAHAPDSAAPGTPAASGSICPTPPPPTVTPLTPPSAPAWGLVAAAAAAAISTVGLFKLAIKYAGARSR